MTKRLIITFGLLVLFILLNAQDKKVYQDAFNEINKMLKGEKPLDFKRAVFLTENAYYKNTLNYNDFCGQINQIVSKLNEYIDKKGVRNNNMRGQFAIFYYMMEPSQYNDNQKLTYDFEDLMGDKDWSKMFVTKLLKTKSGNCHSLPYLYKILADELKSEVYLALGPNHLYVKHKDNKGQWVNVELTNGSFPRDAWLISSLSITTDAIKSEIYMKPLTPKESIALCLYDLAESYKFQFGLDNFVMQLCNTTITYFPKCIMSYMIKADVLEKQREQMILVSKNERSKEVLAIENKINSLYKYINDMGYKDMPKAQYAQWQTDVANEKAKQKQAKTK